MRIIVASLLLVLTTALAQDPKPPQPQPPAVPAVTPVPPGGQQVPPPPVAPVKPVPGDPAGAIPGAPLQGQPLVQKTKGTAKIVCAETTWRFGTASQMTALHHEFRVRNEGDGSLIITQVIPTCQCTASMPKKTSLEPGEETGIDTILNTQTFQGSVTKNITVVSNDPKTPNLLLTIVGEILPPYSVRPKDVSLGNLVKNVDSKPAEIVFTINKGVDVQIKDIKASSANVEVKPDGNLEEQPDGSRTLKFHAVLKAGVPVGLMRETITFMTDSPAIPTSPVVITANIEGEVKLDPKTFNLGRVKRGETAVKELVVTKAGQPDLKIEGVEVAPEGPFATEVITDEPGRKYRIKVTLKADAKDGYHRGTLTVKTNCPGETSLQAWFYAFMGK